VRLAGVAALFFLGAFLVLQGTWKIVWEFHSWAVLSKMGERAPLVDGDPRIRYRSLIVTAAIGVTLMAIAWWVKK
jgi:hypothetical protein